jgi:anthranilate phosphoribosyltransferase
MHCTVIAAAAQHTEQMPTHSNKPLQVAPVRKALGVRTAFNILGPMTNPAGAQHVVIGVFEEELMPLMAGALREVGYIERGVIVHGCGLDEVSPLGPSRVIELRNTVRAACAALLFSY